jgi:hypothetical protein
VKIIDLPNKTHISTMRARRNFMVLRSQGSATSTSFPTTPSSAQSSAYPSEAEGDETTQKKTRPFRFLDLPSELRIKIYGLIFQGTPLVVDLDPDNHRLIHRNLTIFYVSKQIHDEASDFLYSTRVFRIFPCHPGRFFKTKRPLLARLPPRYLDSITSLEFRVGPGFSAPPRGWVVNEALGLKDCVNVRFLKVMVQIDTSNPIFEGFRRGDDGFYESFCKNLLDQILKSVPSIIEIQFDAWASIQRDGPMMAGLLGVGNKYRKLITWGPERGWEDEQSAGCLVVSTLAEKLSEVAVMS